MIESWSRRIRASKAVGRGAMVAALTLAGACTEPEFVVALDGGAQPSPRDAGGTATRDAGPDCGNNCDDPPPTIEARPLLGFASWGTQLPGEYVMRARIFAKGPNNVEEWHELVGRVDVKSEALRAVLSVTEICERKIEWRNGSTVLRTATVAAPWRLERRSFQLKMLEDAVNIFSSTQTSSAVSFVPEACPDKTHRPPQLWLGARQCTCPSDAAGLAATPVKPDDCRVSDLDDDDAPGLALSVSEAGASVFDQVLMKETLTFVNGTTTGRSLVSAFVEYRGDVITLDCGGTGRTCASDTSRGCPAALNPVEFVRNPPVESDAPFSCDQIRAQLKDGTLFKNEPLSFPSTRC